MDASDDAGVDCEAYYKPVLPVLYLALLSIWLVSTCSWTFNTYYKKRHFQTNNLQWTLTIVPLLKGLQLTLSFLFWYSCFHLEICSPWMSFGVYVTGALFQTASFVVFLLISHSYYCIFVSELRTTASLGCIFYLTLVGYRASVPYFSVLLLLNYVITFYIIFHQTSQNNLLVLRNQLGSIEDEDVQGLHDAAYTKCIIFKKFQGAMQIVAVAEAMIYINFNESSESDWVRLLVREWAQLCILIYIGWTFRSQDLPPQYFVLPTLKSKRETIVPLIYTMTTSTYDEKTIDAVIVIIQQPSSFLTTSSI